jgi:ribokinase
VGTVTGNVIALGGINMDLVVEAPRIPRPGETIEGDRFSTTPGGKGANQAVATARGIGEPGRVHMVGCVGDDAYGREMLDFLAADGIGTSHVRTAAGVASGVALIFIDSDAQNCVTAVYGANARCGDTEVAAVESLLPRASVLLVQQETPLAPTLRAMQAARRAGVTTILDPAPARENADSLLPHVDILTPNQTEAEALTGIPVTSAHAAARAAAHLRGLGVAGVILTLGELGCFVDAQGIREHFPALPASPVSTLAAGDAFNGGLAAALATGKPLRDAIPWGLATAALCIERPGAQSAMPTRAEILSRLATG